MSSEHSGSKLRQANPLEVLVSDVWEMYEGYICGGGESMVCAIQSVPLTSQAIDALEKSLQALGFGQNALTQLNVKGFEEGMPALDERVLFSLMEELDPAYVVVTDAAAMALFAKAYRSQLAPQSFTRVFGRNTVTFASFNDMFATPEAKQAAWALLKQLPFLRS